MNSQKLQKLVFSSLFAALCCVATFVIKIPIPATGGYINLGDGFCLLAGWLLGPLYGALAAGIGSCLTDLIAGYFLYVPATFVIKAALAFAASFIFGLCMKSMKKYQVLARMISAIVGEILMVAGYFLYEGCIFGFGAAIGGVLGNCIQAGAGIVLSTVLITVISENKTIKRMLENGSDNK